jgi:hypothetical protein
MMARSATDGTRRDWLLVGAAWLALVLALSAWLAMDRRPPAWDSARQLERTLVCADDVGALGSRIRRDRSGLEAPLVPCAAAVVYRLYPSDVAAAQVVIFLALGAGMAATFLLARDLGGASAAVPAAWLFGTAPIMVATSMRFQLDVPLAAVVAIALLVLSRTDRFTRTGMSAVAGVVLGIGVLVAPTFVLYVAPAVAWLLAHERSFRAIRNFALAVVVAGAACLPWYAPRLITAPMGVVDAVGTSQMRYATGLVQQLGVLATVLIALGLVLALLRGRGFAIVSFVVPLVLVALGRAEGARQTLPLLSAAAVLGGMAIGALPGPARLAGLAIVGLAGLAQVSGVAWAVPPAFALPVLDVPWVMESAPSRADWRHRDVLRAIVADSGGRPVTVSVLPDHASFSSANFRFYARRDRLPLEIGPAWPADPVGVDYVITKSGDPGSGRSAGAGQRAAGQLARDAALARVYPVIAELPLPDGSTVAVRVRRIPDGVAMSPERLAGALETGIRRQLSAVARDVDNLAVRIEHDGDIVRGRVKRIELSADSALLADHRRTDAARLRVRRLGLVAEEVLVNPFSLEANGRAEMLDVGRLRVGHAEIGGDDAQAFLAQLPPFRRTRVRLTKGAMYVTARQPGADLQALLRVLSAPGGRVALQVERAAIGWIPLPSALANWIVRDYDPTERMTSRLSFPVEIGPVSVTEQAVRVGE